MEKGRDENSAFLELMEDSGIKALSAKIDALKVSPLDTSQVKDNVVPARTPSSAILKQKFSGLEPVKRICRRKKKKSQNHVKPRVSIDLHGESRESAFKKVRALLKKSRSYNHGAVLIITGKGLNSEEGGVLRNAVWKLLREYQETNNIKFQWAPPYLGGSGAILVFFS